MRQYWEKFSSKVDELALRERVLIFAAVAFLLVTLVNTVFLDPLLVQQKKLAAQVTQQLIVAVAAFNLVSTLVMTVTDKRADIAILRTLAPLLGRRSRG